jgi:plasmid maintenance system antidote protein VapI
MVSQANPSHPGEVLKELFLDPLGMRLARWQLGSRSRARASSAS